MKNRSVNQELAYKMNSFCYSNLATSLKLYLLQTYPPGSHILMSEIPSVENQKVIKAEIPAAPPLKKEKRLELNTSNPHLSFENKELKEKIGSLFPEFGLEGALMIVKKEETKECEALLQAIRSKLSPCDLFILEEEKELPKGSYKTILGTENALKSAEEKFGSLSGSKMSYQDWSILAKDKEAKKELWNRLTKFFSP